MRELRDEVPDAWHMIEADFDCHAPKQKMTLYLDAPVAKMFKVMGRGYQARINRILATWVEMKIGHVMETEKIMLADRRRAIMTMPMRRGRRRRCAVGGSLVRRIVAHDPTAGVQRWGG